jgi:hypothetical protein
MVLFYLLITHLIDALPAQASIILGGNVVFGFVGDGNLHAPAIGIAGAGKGFPTAGALF